MEHTGFVRETCAYPSLACPFSKIQIRSDGGANQHSNLVRTTLNHLTNSGLSESTVYQSHLPVTLVTVPPSGGGTLTARSGPGCNSTPSQATRSPAATAGVTVYHCDSQSHALQRTRCTGTRVVVSTLTLAAAARALAVVARRGPTAAVGSLKKIGQIR